MSAVITFPLFAFHHYKKFQIILFDSFEVYYWAFSILGHISFIQILNSSARKLTTFIAQQFFITIFFRASFYAAYCAMVWLVPNAITTDTFILCSLETYAQITDYSTWSNAFTIHLIAHYNSPSKCYLTPFLLTNVFHLALNILFYLASFHSSFPPGRVTNGLVIFCMLSLLTCWQI